jgi:hypothetical protein
LEEERAFQKAMEEVLSPWSGFSDPYLKWVFPDPETYSAEKMFHAWSLPLREFFAELIIGPSE